MKSITFLVFFLCGLTVFSQNKIKVSVVDRPSSLGIETAFETTVPMADLKKAEGLFNRAIAQKKFFGLMNKKTGNSKKGEEWITNKFVLGKVSDKPMVVLFQVSNFSTQTYIRFFFQMNNGFLGAEHVGTSREVDKAKQFVHDYAADLYGETLKDQIVREQKVYDKLEKKYDKHQRNNVKIKSNYISGKPSVDKKRMDTDYVNVGQAIDQESKYLKGEKSGQKKIRRNQKKQAGLKAQMKNQKILLNNLQDELNAIE